MPAYAQAPTTPTDPVAEAKAQLAQLQRLQADTDQQAARGYATEAAVERVHALVQAQQLYIEVLRLRALLAEHKIDPDTGKAIPDPPGKADSDVAPH